MHAARRRLTAAAAAVTVALSGASCSQGGAGARNAAGIVRASWGDPQNPLEPANTNEVQGGKVMGMIFRGLKRYDPKTGRARNMVAESIISGDQQNFTITLKPGWTFSDGTPVTAKSFVDAWNYAALVTNKQINAPFFGYIEGYEQVHPEAPDAAPSATTMSGLKIVDERTFTVRLTQKFSTWPQTLGYTAFVPLPEVFFTDHDTWLRKPVGNGPYTVDSYTKGTGMKLSRSKNYHGPDRARNGGVELKVYTDSNTAYTDLQAGNLDVSDDIPAFQLPNVAKDLGQRYINQPVGVTHALSFPMYRHQFGSDTALKLRQGLSMAIDRAQITKTIYHGTYVPATDWTSPVLQRTGGYRPGLCGQLCTYNPQRARQLIEAAGGLPGGKVTLTANVDTGSHRLWMEAVCNDINNVLGKDDACTVHPEATFAGFREQVVAGQMTGPFWSGWQMDYPLIQDFLQPLYYTKASGNDSGYSSKAFDKLVDQANAEDDTAAAVRTFQQAEQVLAEDFPVIPLWYQNGTAGYSSKVSDVALDAFDIPVFTDIKVSG
ncbi:ABC transporter substrate-binding protein [Streptomyces sp. NBC_01381]|uniref:peptide ABC transporter substrate-binding protein n=1 Tax=Streptomyces sp. NBC_01381 TaxID=2903845 RepID=UPI00225032FA|nr:ABC transporter substrate-binding protein [Streptomyces sp. NBC_01381]MCX4673560.1 ABC transporter substrate-binding protein [Streptomyces sp. NBC_01381]